MGDHRGLRQNRGLYAYIIGISCLTLGVLAYCVYLTLVGHATSPATLRLVALFAMLAWAASQRRVLVSESSDHVMGTSAQIATLLSVSLPAAIPAVAILTVAIAKTLSELTLLVKRHRMSWRASAVNVSATLLANSAALGTFILLRGNTYIWRNDVHAVLAVPALVLMALAYESVEALIVTGAIMLTSKESFVKVFSALVRDTFLPEMSLALTGIIFAILWHFRPALSLFVILPVTLSIRSFESVARLRKETVEAVVKMAESIDYRDTSTYQHSQRISDLSKRLAKRLGITAEHQNDIGLAGKVHDLGKIGISNDILLKQGPLTAEEREVMNEHPNIGASILESYSAFRGSVAIVRHHHERWDGQGYPDGLKGEEIPLGSRIIGIVDAFDSMTQDRPYRNGMSVVKAVDRLKQGMGTQFDPRICGVFIQMLIDDEVYIPSEEAAVDEPQLQHLRVMDMEAV